MARIELGSTLDGRYRIERLTGRGALSDVYLALDVRLNRLVALKVLSSGFVDDPEFLRRFEREMRVTAQLDHPNILRVYDFGLSVATAYLVTEYVDGGSLEQRLAEAGGPLDPDFALAIVAQVGDALGYAHGKGIVHLDVKPGNILMGSDGRVLLGDFGLAQLMEDGPRASSLTTIGTVLGTPAYMSPEQAMGEPLDGRSDIYSLGIVLYRLLTGSVPFESASPTDTMYQQVKRQPRPPRELNLDLPPELEQVALTALAKDPAERYQTAGDFVAALRSAAGAGSQVTPRPSGGRPEAAQQPAQPAAPPRGVGSITTEGPPVARRAPKPRPEAAPVRKASRRIPIWIEITLAAAALVALGLLFAKPWDNAALVRALPALAPIAQILVLVIAGLVTARLVLSSRRRYADPLMRPRVEATSEAIPIGRRGRDAAQVYRRAPDVAAFLLVLNGPQRGQQLRLAHTPASIGRVDSDVTIGDRSISRRHAEIELAQGRFAIRDLDSSNGTFVNGVLLRGARRELRDRDEIRVGNINLIFMQIATDVSPEATRRLQEFDAIWDDLAQAVRRE